MGGTPCRAKIIMNGAVVQGILHEVCYQIQEEEYVGSYDHELKMVALLNEMEDIAFKFQRLYLESQGFEGPWPYSLTQED